MTVLYYFSRPFIYHSYIRTVKHFTDQVEDGGTKSFQDGKISFYGWQEKKEGKRKVHMFKHLKNKRSFFGQINVVFSYFLSAFFWLNT